MSGALPFKTIAELNAHLATCKRGCDLCEEQVETLGNYEQLRGGSSKPIPVPKKHKPNWKDQYWESTP